MAAFSDPVVAAGVAGLVALYAKGAVRPVDVVELYLARIARHNPTLNAFVELDADAARRDAAASSERWAHGAPLSPIDGVPIAVKANIAVAGLAWTAGIGAYRHQLALEDAACVTALRAAGAVILGTLNMHEAALGATNDNPWFGRCENPHRPGFTPGGSSGGSAAAVAAGLCAAALGTDTMGSVRLPSSYCGVVGYKPALGAISTQGVIALSWTLDHVGVHARGVADAVLVAQAAGVAVTPAKPDPRPLAALDFTDVVAVEASVASGFSSVLAAITSEGVTTAPLRLDDLDLGVLRRLGLLLSEVEGFVEHEAALSLRPEGFSEGLRRLLAWGAACPAPALARAHRRLRRTADLVRDRLAGHAGLLTPTTPQTAFSFDAPVPSNQADFTALGNILGAPAFALPSGLSAEGLPLSIQLIGLDEANVQVLAARLEATLPAAPVPEAFA
jgi:aspartyl-tRNA(Asn)/glutamyl-tRNA(Gln) amidotransferase subunit A